MLQLRVRSPPHSRDQTRAPKIHLCELVAQSSHGRPARSPTDYRAAKPAMPAISHQRARSPQDKDLRRAHLIQAATRLFADADFEAVTIARVAEAAGVAKGAAYIYFATKETLFLELVRAELTQWLAALTVTLKRLRSPRPAAAVPAANAKKPERAAHAAPPAGAAAQCD